LETHNYELHHLPQAGGKLAVLYPTGAVEAAIKDVPAGTPYAIVDSLDIDHAYFDGYVFDGGSAVVDISACKNIHLEKFRAARAPKLAALDVQFMRAVESGDSEKQAEVAAQKQALRDVTKTPLPDDLAGIKATWPSILN
jgi:hypothetical protein